ncbi:MAG: phosphohistidine phosphatase SixA [Nitrospirota bacterium]|nr:MAG: phosphohistidine phosphatase SixA [Nitrospirota bacterium]
MRLYLVRHGEALSQDEDPERGLSATGMHDINKVASHMAARGVAVESIFHSGKKRARQTAEIIAGAIDVKKDVFEAAGLRPEDDPSIWAGKLSGMEKDVMLVGHLPHLGALATRLTGVRGLTLGTGQAICIMLGKDGSGSVKWTVAPQGI